MIGVGWWERRKKDWITRYGLQTTNEGMNQRNLKCLGNMTDKHASVVITVPAHNNDNNNNRRYAYTLITRYPLVYLVPNFCFQGGFFNSVLMYGLWLVFSEAVCNQKRVILAAVRYLKIWGLIISRVLQAVSLSRISSPWIGWYIFSYSANPTSINHNIRFLYFLFYTSFAKIAKNQAGS